VPPGASFNVNSRAVSRGMPCSKTYRVQGLPVTFTEEDCRRLLSSILAGTNENPEPTIHSLSIDPYAAECSIATVTFNSDPARFQDGREEWTFSIPISRIPRHSTALSSIGVYAPGSHTRKLRPRYRVGDPLFVSQFSEVAITDKEAALQ
jgi:hypothetical protein